MQEMKTLSRKFNPTETINAKIDTSRGYFSVTGEIGTPRQIAKGDPSICGCIHGEIMKAWPKLTPLVALHLSDLDGVPMHAVENGFHWVSGIHNVGAKYAPDQSKEECTQILADHLRIGFIDASDLALATATHATPKTFFTDCVNAMKPRWKTEAAAGLALIETL
jgi:hypothetical protein